MTSDNVDVHVNCEAAGRRAPLHKHLTNIRRLRLDDDEDLDEEEDFRFGFLVFEKEDMIDRLIFSW